MLHRRVSDYRKMFFIKKNSLENSYLATINSLAYAIEARDIYTRGHSERVATYAVWLGEKMGLTRSRIRMIQHSCRLHDVGKIGIPDKILLKPARLTLEERAQIELHPVYGVEILGDLKFIMKGLPLILHHHERYDGKGYPYGLRKNAIPLDVRIVTVADAFDAMTSDRPYRKAMAIEEVIAEFKRCSGSQFDPAIVKVLLKLIDASNPRSVAIPMKAA